MDLRTIVFMILSVLGTIIQTINIGAVRVRSIEILSEAEGSDLRSPVTIASLLK